VARGLSPIASANGGSVGDRVPWGREHRRAYAERFDRTITVAVIGEDLPEPENRVDLDPALTDSNGIPAPRVSYRLSENSRRMLDHGLARAREVLQAAGAHDVAFNPLLRAGGWHLMGTARMGRDPATSVVDGEGRCHDVPNLYIVDGSVIQAVALHVADGMIRRRR
jgi:choline dehydrogenase-like flavoprotein